MIYKLFALIYIFSLNSYSNELPIKEYISNSEQFFELIFENINNEKINIKFENNMPKFLSKFGVNNSTQIILDNSKNQLRYLDDFKKAPFTSYFKDFYKDFIERTEEMVDNLIVDIIDENIVADKKLSLINTVKYKYGIELKNMPLMS